MLSKEQLAEIRARCEAGDSADVAIIETLALLDMIDKLESGPRRKNDKRVAILAESRDRWKATAKRAEATLIAYGFTDGGDAMWRPIRDYQSECTNPFPP